MNTNGLTSIPSSYYTGSVTSNIWARKDQPVVNSELTVLGKGGVSAVVIDSNNAGQTAGSAHVLLSDTSSDGKDYRVASEIGDVFITNVTDDKEVLKGDGDELVLCGVSSTPLVVVGESQGRVYDTVYNPIATVTPLWTSTATLSPGDTLEGEETLAAGRYMLQLNLTVVNVGTLSLGTSVVAELQSGPAGPVPDFSGLSIVPSLIILPSAGSSNQFAFTSGVFTITEEADYNLSIEIAGTWNLGTGGSLVAQVVKLA